MTIDLPHPSLTPLSTTDGKPNFASLKLLHKEINDNAMTTPCVRSPHGHLALTISTASYTALTGAPFNTPVHPGDAPMHQPGATGPQITETNRLYISDLALFNVLSSVEASLKKQLLAAVPRTFIDELDHELYGFAGVSTLAILTHLDTTYGTITTDDLNQNLDALHRTWSTDQPIEDLWKQLRQCVLFAAPIDPISDLTAIRAAITNLEKSGVFSDAIKDWRKLDANAQTMAMLKDVFNKADCERLRSVTSRDAGFSGAAITTPGAGTAVTINHTNGLHYCWSHGLGRTALHTSANCRTKLQGHREDATVHNMMGGCNYIQRRPGEVSLIPRIPRAPRTPAPSSA